MATECIDSFEMCGRQFMVLWKPSATYLRADGHMWGDSLGADLAPEAAIEQARLRAELMLINERSQEEKLVHRLFEKPMAAEVADLAKDYICFSVTLPGQPGSSVAVTADAVYAPFNHNTYLCTQLGWCYVGSFPSQDEAIAALVPWCEAQQARPCCTLAQPFWQSTRAKVLGLMLLALIFGLFWW